MKNKLKGILFFLFALVCFALSIWGPEALAKYKDKGILGEAHLEAVETEGEGKTVYTVFVSEKSDCS